ncbi:MAG: polymorphic toxin type 50 domain-containing protein [Pseudomonadota bacterium]
MAQTGGVVGALVEAVRRMADTNRNTAMANAGLTPADPEEAPRGYAKRMYEYLTGTYASAADVAQTSDDAASERYQTQHDYGITESITNLSDTGEEISFTYVVTEDVTESYYEAEGDTLYEVTKTYEVKKEYPVTYEYGNSYSAMEDFYQNGGIDPVNFDTSDFVSGECFLSDSFVSEYDAGGYDPSNFDLGDYKETLYGTDLHGRNDDLGDSGSIEPALDQPGEEVQAQDAFVNAASGSELDGTLDKPGTEVEASGDEAKTSSQTLVDEFTKLRPQGGTDEERYDAGYQLGRWRMVSGQPVPDTKDFDDLLDDPFWKGLCDGVYTEAIGSPGLASGAGTKVLAPSMDALAAAGAVFTGMRDPQTGSWVGLIPPRGWHRSQMLQDKETYVRWMGLFGRSREVAEASWDMIQRTKSMSSVAREAVSYRFPYLGRLLKLIDQGAEWVAGIAQAQTTVKDQIRNAEQMAVNSNSRHPIHWGQQGKHIAGHNDYQPGRSPVSVPPEELQQLVDKLAGTGQPRLRSSGKPGSPGYSETVDFGRVLGYDFDDETGLLTPTTKGAIHYGSSGVHVVPVLH